jgi:ankyrin repeat protein
VIDFVCSRPLFVESSTAESASMGDLDKLIKAIKLRDVDQVATILDEDGHLVNAYDEMGATALHCAAFDGFREVVQLLLDRGAEINRRDSQFGATPAGWAIEYLRERGGYLGIELSDFAYAIELGDVRWVARFLRRFPALRQATDINGKSFRELAEESGNREVMALFRLPGEAGS